MPLGRDEFRTKRKKEKEDIHTKTNRKRKAEFPKRGINFIKNQKKKTAQEGGGGCFPQPIKGKINYTQN